MRASTTTATSRSITARPEALRPAHACRLRARVRPRERRRGRARDHRPRAQGSGRLRSERVARVDDPITVGPADDPNETVTRETGVANAKHEGMDATPSSPRGCRTIPYCDPIERNARIRSSSASSSRLNAGSRGARVSMYPSSDLSSPALTDRLAQPITRSRQRSGNA
jgi:hypothetical protein